MRQRIIIQDVMKPKHTSLNSDVRWICDSLGFSSGRDIEGMSFKVMFNLLEQFTNDEIVASDSISSALGVETPRVNHHLRNLMESGIIFRERRKIALRGGSLSSAIREIKHDSERMFDRLLEEAARIDRAMQT